MFQQHSFEQDKTDQKAGNLTNFDVDLDTTSRLMKDVPEGTIVCALSGISSPEDVEAYQNNGVGAVLVGEALMRAEDPSDFACRLLGGSQNRKESHKRPEILIKICGTRSPEAAKVAIEAGADMIGIILVEGRKRCVSRDTALEISRTIHESPKPDDLSNSKLFLGRSTEGSEYFEHTTSFFRRRGRALLVGVFQNQPLSFILEQQELLELDVVQLHGSEPIEWTSLIPVPVIRRFGPSDPGLGRRGYHALPLLDSALGGTGQKQDIGVLRKALEADSGLRVVLAGGLDPENVESVFQDLAGRCSQIAAVDVSSGVEVNGKQDFDKIRRFVKNAKSAGQRYLSY